MEAYNFFIDRDGHLRSGWRLAIFCPAFLICLQVTQFIFLAMLSIILHRPMSQVNAGLWSVAAGHGSILFSSLVVGWACGALLEGLPFKALGTMPHRGWWR